MHILVTPNKSCAVESFKLCFIIINAISSLFSGSWCSCFFMMQLTASKFFTFFLLSNWYYWICRITCINTILDYSFEKMWLLWIWENISWDTIPLFRNFELRNTWHTQLTSQTPEGVSLVNTFLWIIIIKHCLASFSRKSSVFHSCWKSPTTKTLRKWLRYHKLKFPHAR